MLNAPFSIYGADLLVSASVGVAISSAAEPTTDAETMFRDADTAMYQAKAAGRDMVTLFDDSMRDRIADRLALEHDLRRALERNEFCLMYQPIVTLDEEGAIVAGLEALLRWDRPTRGIVPASFFIECAEASGLLTEIGDWVIRESARQLADWRRVPGAEGLFVSVNVSRLHLKSARAGGPGAPSPRRDRPGPRRDVHRAQRVDAHGQPGRGGGTRHPDEGARGPPGRRQLRERVRVVGLPQAVPGRLREDRPPFHRGADRFGPDRRDVDRRHRGDGPGHWTP